MKKVSNVPTIITYVGVLITLILTPWLNVDALIVPKMLVLFSLSAYLIPQIIFIKKSKTQHLELKIMYILSCLIVGQMLLVMIMSTAPLEQQIFGRGGRGLGFITYFSLIIVLIATTQKMSEIDSKLIIRGIVLSSAIASIYSLFQNFNLDFFSWVSRTNGIIGTLGNPNFQSALAATALILNLSLITKGNFKNNFVVLSTALVLIFTIYVCQSTQGYVAASLSVITFSSLYFWIKNKKFFYMFSSAGVFVIILALIGMTNNGPLSGLLYKYSLKSRAEMWRTALSASSDNKAFGVGLDSFGDYSYSYKSVADALGVNEFTDNSHNFFLEYAVTGGYPLAALHGFLILLVLFSFFKSNSHNAVFDKNLCALFSAWVALQAQSLISPATIPLLFWNFVISGYIIKRSIQVTQLNKNWNDAAKQHVKYTNVYSVVLLVVSLILMVPFFNADRQQLKSLNSGDALRAVESAKLFPESVTRYHTIGLELTKSGLMEQALEVARAAVNFNSNSFSAWALVLANDLATPEEKLEALAQLRRLDPYNKMLKDLRI